MWVRFKMDDTKEKISPKIHKIPRLGLVYPRKLQRELKHCISFAGLQGYRNRSHVHVQEATYIRAGGLGWVRYNRGRGPFECSFTMQCT
jgi:hypothetical protein